MHPALGSELRRLREDIRAAEHAAARDDLHECLVWLRNVELGLHDCRRHLEKLLHPR